VPDIEVRSFRVPEHASKDHIEVWRDVVQCRQCEIARDAQNKVFYRGTSEKPRILFIGEAPGANEDRLGEPFVGDAGMLLDEAIDFAEIDSFGITNIIKCRPPRNRTPLREEINNCLGYLVRQIGILEPKLIVALGRYAIGALQNNWNFTLSRVRGDLIYSAKVGRFFLATYHPAAQIYAPELRDTFLEDIRKAATVSKS